MPTWFSTAYSPSRRGKICGSHRRNCSPPRFPMTPPTPTLTVSQTFSNTLFKATRATRTRPRSSRRASRPSAACVTSISPFPTLETPPTFRFPTKPPRIATHGFPSPLNPSPRPSLISRQSNGPCAFQRTPRVSSCAFASQSRSDNLSVVPVARTRRRLSQMRIAPRAAHSVPRHATASRRRVWTPFDFFGAPVVQSADRWRKPSAAKSVAPCSQGRASSGSDFRRS